MSSTDRVLSPDRKKFLKSFSNRPTAISPDRKCCLRGPLPSQFRPFLNNVLCHNLLCERVMSVKVYIFLKELPVESIYENIQRNSKKNSFLCEKLEEEKIEKKKNPTDQPSCGRTSKQSFFWPNLLLQGRNGDITLATY